MNSLPTPGTYAIDSSHSTTSFSVRHLGLSKVRGGFGSFSGVVTIAEVPEQSSVSVTIDAASFSTGNDDRDGHVKSADFLDVERFPRLTFESTAVRPAGRSWQVDGDLTIRDTTRSVTLDVDFEGTGEDPWGNARIAFAASTEIVRDDFGVSFNQALETGGVLIGKNVKIDIDVQAVAQVSADV